MPWSGSAVAGPARAASGGPVGRIALVAGVLVATAVLVVALVAVFGRSRRPTGGPTAPPGVALNTRITLHHPGAGGERGSGSGSGRDATARGRAGPGGGLGLDDDNRPDGGLGSDDDTGSVWSSDPGDQGASVGGGSGAGGGSAAAAWRSGWSSARPDRTEDPVPTAADGVAEPDVSPVHGSDPAPALGSSPSLAPMPDSGRGRGQARSDADLRGSGQARSDADLRGSGRARSDADLRGSGRADQGPSESGPTSGLRLSCTREVDNLEELHDVMINSGPDDILCVRGPRTRPAALSAVTFARSQLGEPYRWGGNGRADGGFDCSGLTSASYASAGVPIPRTAQAQFDAGHRVSIGQIQAGDLVFFGSGPRGVRHVGLAVSPTQMINAPDRGQVVSVGPIQRHDFVGATRPVPVEDSGRAADDDSGASGSDGGDTDSAGRAGSPALAAAGG